MKFVSLFAGIGGFDLGFENAGMRCVAQVEKDKSCLSVLAHHWPNTQRFDDVHNVGAHNLPPADVVCGGFPCQDLSVAGKRQGLKGARSRLFYEMTRICNELRPSYIVWENVPGLLSSESGRDFAAVIMALDRIGYSGAWTVLNSRYFGVAQRRRRVFGVFARADIGTATCAEILAFPSRMRGHSPQGRNAQAEIATDIAASLRVDSGKTTTQLDAEHGLVAAPRVARQAKGAFTDPVHDNVIVIQHATIGRKPENGPQGAGWRDDGVAWTMDSRPVSDVIAFGVGQIAVAGALDRMAGGVDDNAAQVNHIVAFKGGQSSDARTLGISSDVTPTLSAATSGSNQVPDVAGTFGVRHLTPRECERLQGFPDDWTRWGADGKEISDSRRYRMLGNAVTRSVAEWIGKQIVKVQKVQDE